MTVLRIALTLAFAALGFIGSYILSFIYHTFYENWSSILLFFSYYLPLRIFQFTLSCILPPKHFSVWVVLVSVIFTIVFSLTHYLGTYATANVYGFANAIIYNGSYDSYYLISSALVCWLQSRRKRELK